MKIPWDDVVKAIIVFALTGVIGYLAMLMVRALSSGLKALLAKAESYLMGMWGKAVAPIVDEIALIKAEVALVKAQTLRDGGGTLRDALERVEAALELTSAINRAMLGFTNENKGLFLTNEKGELTWISDQVLRWVQRSSNEVIGHGSGDGPRWLTMIAPEEQRDVEAWWTRTHTAGVQASMRQTYLAADGERIHVIVYATPVFSATGELLAYVGMIVRIGDSQIGTERTNGIAG